jgi:20S proteasome alpha/beta subunit
MNCKIVSTNSFCNFLAGKGCVFSFDPVGSYEREIFRAAGSASSLLQPLLDNQVCGIFHIW